MPDKTGRVFLLNPLSADGPETEGASASFAVDSTRAIPVVVVGGKPPEAGDLLVALAVGGRWVAEGSPDQALGCSPCPIPRRDLTLSWAGGPHGGGSTPLVYTAPGRWNSACANQMLYSLSCPGGSVRFAVTYFVSGGCPGRSGDDLHLPGRRPAFAPPGQLQLSSVFPSLHGLEHGLPGAGGQRHYRVRDQRVSRGERVTTTARSERAMMLIGAIDTMLTGHLSERCPSCPVQPGRACEGSRFPRLCELADPGHKVYRPAYRVLLQRLAGEAQVPGAVAEQDPVVRHGRRPHDVGESISLIRTMSACPHRRTRTDCGCGGLGRCTLGKGRDGLVNHLDCFECLRAGHAGPVPVPAGPELTSTAGSPALSLDRSLDHGAKRQ